ncbi:MAG: hypothetical protein FWD78_13270 [Treponema sp.]|nr:hypothetical protein [Treponema sp.]
MKKFFQALVIFALFAAPLQAQSLWGTRFFWSFGDIGVSWDTISGKYDPTLFLNAGNINWITAYNVGFGFHLFDLEANSKTAQTLLLPVEINFNPLRQDSGNPILTLYGRGGLQTRFDTDSSKSFFERSNFFGAAGLRLAWLPAVGKNWSIYTGGFVEYTTRGELRAGLSVDVTIMTLIWLYTAADSNNNSGNNKRR